MKPKKSSILFKKIEGINRFVFEKKYKAIRDLIRQKTKNDYGVYALYNKTKKLYYVGQTKKDIIKRVQCHLKGKHKGKWDYFSVYFTEKEEHAREVESIILSVLPEVKGNTQNQSKIGEDKELKKEIKGLKKEIDKGTPILAEIGPKKPKKAIKKQKIQRQSKARDKNFSLVGLFEIDKPLKATYKKQEYRAMLLTSGKVLYKGKEYNSLGGATKAIGSGASGFVFWQIQDHKNRWITLSTLREKSNAFKKVA